MKNILTIYLKELKDTLRDRRTIIMMLVIPLVFFPILMTVTMKISISQQKKATAKNIRIAVVSHGNGAGLIEKIKEREDFEIRNETEIDRIKEMIKKGTLDFAIELSKDFDSEIQKKAIADVVLYFRFSSEINIMKRRVAGIINDFKSDVLSKRLTEIGLSDSFVTPFNITHQDLASQKEKVGKTIGGFLPYLFVIFSFLGAFYPAIDLAAGEKERGTIETLLVSPANRLQIVMGKFWVVMQASLMSAVVGFIGIFIAIKQMGDAPSKIINVLFKILEFKSIALVFSLLIPVSIFFAAILLSLSIYAKSFKEAQSIITPLNFVVIVPAIIGMMPGIKLNLTTSLIPILNISLASKEILAGTIEVQYLILTYVSLFILAGISLVFCTRWFNREDVIFRGV